MCLGQQIGLDTFLETSMSMYDLTSTFLGPDLGEKQKCKFLGCNICRTSYGLTHYKSGTCQPPMVSHNDEYDVRSHAHSIEELQRSSIPFHLTIP